MDKDTAERIIRLNSAQPNTDYIRVYDAQGRPIDRKNKQFKLLDDIIRAGVPLSNSILKKAAKMSKDKQENRYKIFLYKRDHVDEDYFIRGFPDMFVPSPDFEITDVIGLTYNRDVLLSLGERAPLPQPPPPAEEEEEEEAEEEEENPVVPQAPIVQEEIQEPEPVPIEEAVPLQEQVNPGNIVEDIRAELADVIDQRANQIANERLAQDERAREIARIERNELNEQYLRLHQEQLAIQENITNDMIRRREQLERYERRGQILRAEQQRQRLGQLEEQLRRVNANILAQENALIQAERAQLQQIADQMAIDVQRINEENAQLENRNREIQEAQGAIDAHLAQAENEVPRVRPFDQLVDDLNEVYLREGYDPDEQRELNNIFQNRPEQEILDFIEFARGRGPVDYRDFENREIVQAPVGQLEPPLAEPEDVFFDAIEPPEAEPGEEPLAEPLVGPEEPLVAVGDAVQEPQGLVGGQEQGPPEPEPEPEQGPVVPGQAPGPAIGSGTPDKLQYKKRYHETSLRLFFQNSSVPNWDPVLESNIMSLDIPKREIVEMMEQVISEYGPVIHVTKRKSSTLEELNELVQLQFCVMRNLHMGPRTRTATVKLSDLENLQRVAAGGAPVMNGANAAQPIEVRVPQESDTPLVQTKEEFNFYKNYDRVQHLKSLGDYVRQVNRNPFIKTKNDARTLGLIKGNNFKSVADYAKIGPHRLKPLSTFVRKNKS